MLKFEKSIKENLLEKIKVIMRIFGLEKEIELQFYSYFLKVNAASICVFSNSNYY
jgi:hypothetical protein